MSSIILEGITIEEFAKLIHREVKEACEGTQQTNYVQGLLNREETAKKLGISISLLDKLTGQGKIPCKSIGNRRLYELNKVIDALPGTEVDK